MKPLSKDQILQADDLPTEVVEVPEWGGSVTVRTLTGAQRDKLEESIVSSPGQRNLTNLRARLVALAVVDENNEPMFTFEDATVLGNKSARALDRVFASAQRLSGFTKQDVEDIAKN